MRFRTMLAIAVSAVLTVFFILNWRVFTAPAKLSLLVGSVDAPIGIVMLALFALGLLVLSSYLGVWQGTLLMEFRRQAKELQAQRTLAENAEASRFTELGTLIRDELANSDKRVETALEGLRSELRETENSIAATLGEMDDRYQRTADRHAG
ncbi:MAG: LapA family protein [Steroidobacteraceae bacterium]